MKEVLRIQTIAVLLALMLVAANYALAGRGDKAGTSAAPELMIPVGARDVALGGSSLATTAGVEAIFWNPAGLSRSSVGSEVMFSHMNYIADIGVEYLALGATFEGFGSLGFSLKALSIGDIAITTETSPDGNGELFSPTYIVAGLTYSRLLTDRVSVGLTTKLISERIDRVSASGVAFDVGVQYDGFAGVSGLSIGVAVKNIGPAMQFDGSGLLRAGTTTGAIRPETPVQLVAATDELPSTIELGLGYKYRPEEQHTLMVSSLFQNNNLSDDEYKFGLEYSYDNTFFLRGGYSLSAETITDSYIYGPSAGGGIHYTFTNLIVTVDYAFRDVDFLQPNHVFSIKLGF
jgi:hypothetical protein